jgi:hypothetical protein
MMTLRHCTHSIKQPTLGGLAYWSMFTNVTMINGDREPVGGLS